MAYDYEGRVDFRGDTAKAMEFTRDLLKSKGFNVLPLSGNQVYFENDYPGPFLNLKKQSLLTVVSKGCVTVTSGALTLQAEFGILWRQLKLIPIVLVIVAFAVKDLLVEFVKDFRGPGDLWPLVVAVAVILLALPLASRRERRYASLSLEALLKEAAGAGEQK